MRFLLPLLLFLLPATAQFIVQIKPTKAQYVAHEDIEITLSITNRAGKQLTLTGKKFDNWLDINIYDQRRNLLPYKGTPPIFKAVRLPAGQTVEKRINLSEFYDLTRYGRYSLTADVNLPGNTEEVMRSNTGVFTITNGRVLTTQKIGIPGTISARGYEVIRFNNDKRSHIYVKITNDFTKQVESCQALSQHVPFEDPQVALDRSNNLHLLYLITHSTYIHHVLNPQGQVIKRNYHRPGSYGKPRLESFAKGDVKVAGTVIFDPVKAREEARQDKKLSERPEF